MSNASALGGPRYVGAVARVDLLPKEVRDQAAAKQTRRTMLLLIVLAIVVVAAGFAAVQLLVATSASDLVAANAETQRLTTQQASYQRVRALQAANAEADSMNKVTTATQIDWDALLTEAFAPLPGSVTIGTITADSQSPLFAPDQTQSPFGRPAIGSIVVSLTSPNIDDLTSWLAAVRADATFSSVTALQTQNGDGIWQLSATLYISPSVTALPTPTPSAVPTNGGN